jgi:hypothetical protein
MSVEIQRVVDDATIAVVKLDATIATGLSFPSTVTEHAIEDGSTIADHVRNNPDVVTVTGFVTNTPAVLAGVGADDGLARGALDSLLEMRDNKEIVQIVTDVKLFTDMMMTSLDVPRDAANANSLNFTAVFQEVRKVATEVTQFPEDDTARRAAPPSELGKQTPVETEESTESFALGLFRSLGIVD